MSRITPFYKMHMIAQQNSLKDSDKYKNSTNVQI